MEELILKERETKDTLIEIINKSGLPAFILKPILQDMITQLNIIEVSQYEEAKKNKEKSSKKGDK